MTEGKEPEPLETMVKAIVGSTLAEAERHLILGTLDRCSGNRTRAAKILGISVRTLRNKLSEYVEAGVNVPEPGRERMITRSGVRRELCRAIGSGHAAPEEDI